MAKPVLAMEKGEIKSIMKRAGGDPVNCAVMVGKEPAFALFRVDLRKSPKMLLNALQVDFPDAKTPAFGTVRIAPDDETLMMMTLNKVPSGTARRVLKAIKGSGIKRLEIIGEDGSGDTLTDQEEDAEGAEEPAAAALDAAELTARLRALGGRVKELLATAPGRQAELVGFVAGAQGGLKSGDLAGASAVLDRLEAALGGTTAPGAAAVGPGAKAVPEAQGAVAYGKSRLTWLATRRKMETDLTALEQALTKEFAGDPAAAQIPAAFRTRVAPILQSLDERLADKLDEAMNAADAPRRAALVAEAREVIEAYSTFVAGEPLIADLDDNPFVPLSIGSTLRTSLAALSKAVR